MKNNRRLRVRVRISFILFYSELASSDQWCNLLQTLLGGEKYKAEMSDKVIFNLCGVCGNTKVSLRSWSILRNWLSFMCLVYIKVVQLWWDNYVNKTLFSRSHLNGYSPLHFFAKWVFFQGFSAAAKW